MFGSLGNLVQGPVAKTAELPQVLERQQLDRLWQLLSQTCLADHLVLVGSAAVYRTPSSLPPLTTDADYAIDQSILRQHLDEFLAQLQSLGFERVADTSTFVHPDGFSFDLLGLDAPGLGDRVADFSNFSAMVFEDLCQVVAEPGAIQVGPDQGRVLSPPALVLSKLRTWRREKGIKDKLQALALVGELGQSAEFQAQLVLMVGRLSGEDWQDLLADAQAAFIGLGREEGREYAHYGPLVERGFQMLIALRPAL